MKNELTKLKENQLALLNSQQLSEAIKPLNREIHLFDTYIAGTLFLKDPQILKEIKVNDDLVLKRQETVFDSNTIDIYRQDGEKLGYIPEKDNVVFARLMDAGKCLIARVSEIKDKKAMTVITIGIYLVDF